MAGRLQDEVVPDTSHLSTQQLRTLAQSHLVEIEDEDTAETARLVQGQSDIQKYSKTGRRGKDRSPNHQKESSALLTTAPDTKGPRLRTAQDVLDRLRWDPSIKLDEYRVGYLERFEGIKEMPVAQWVRETTEEEFIPQHRIKFVKRVVGDGQQEVVWDRDERVDKLFGSGVTGSSVS
ncbi:hypothetical protein K431DRAFT_283229 [Polychaeton citri CBS 116435]|uniref:MJ1316 RNA cyclic group end recognition domain-containing protein n=1 Tax=Polychaeton citri CBS 116435 TaxID=1314669 RepID=A0A9P4Q9F9_9PEZI|nr:hypothetical protein K431DRAFT_283229 [Polychaeton citri CBS 116435]